MVRIFNHKERKEILIDDSVDWIQVMPRDYDEDDPHILIEMKDGFDWADHARSCPDCKSLLSALGRSDANWWLSWNDKTWQLNLLGVGPLPGKNRLVYEIGEFFDGTRLKLRLDSRTDAELEADLRSLQSAEDYEQCAIVRDRIAARTIVSDPVDNTTR